MPPQLQRKITTKSKYIMICSRIDREWEVTSISITEKEKNMKICTEIRTKNIKKKNPSPPLISWIMVDIIICELFLTSLS